MGSDNESSMSCIGKANKVIGVVLAGGKSSRMGQDKALMTLSGDSLLNRSRKLLKDAGMKQVVISRNQQGFMQDLIGDLGPIGAIHTALQTLDGDGFIFVAVDTPFIQPTSIRRLLEYGLTNQSAVIFNRSSLPIFLPASEEIKAMVARMVNNQESLAIRALLGQINTQSLPLNNQNELLNTNTPSDWLQASQIEEPRSA